MIVTTTKCKLRSVIHFLFAQVHSMAGSHRRMSNVYGNNFMSVVCVRKCCKSLKKGVGTDVYYVCGQGRTFETTKDIIKKVNKVVMKDVDLQFSNCILTFLTFQDHFSMMLCL